MEGVRGVAPGCNSIIGLVREDPELLKRIALYLETSMQSDAPWQYRRDSVAAALCRPVAGTLGCRLSVSPRERIIGGIQSVLTDFCRYCNASYVLLW